jgi:hypothetical protein
MKNNFKINDTVSVNPKNGIPIFSFVGIIIDYLEETNEFLVRDQDDDVFQCDEDQLEIVED